MSALNPKPFKSLCFSCQESAKSFEPIEQRQSIGLETQLPGVIVIAGPTAVGKSHLAMLLAKALGGEIVSADSMQVYRGMDIGTAKPNLLEQAQLVHHMIDIKEVNDPINVAEFTHEAMRAISSICARGRVPIVVGGSGFYIDAILRGAPSGPPADPFVRAHLEGEMERLGPESLYEELAKFDPDYAQTITRADRHKILRALEIMIVSKTRVSDFGRHRSQGPKEYHFLCYFLHRPRDILYERINRRCEEMLEKGLIGEVQKLLAQGLLENPSAASAIGYRQTLEFFKSSQTPEDFKKFIDSFTQASRHYAKRQFTWFRRDEAFTWIDLESQSEEQLLERLHEEYRSI